ncbi:MAG: DUF3006 domain-containing protein [Clostridia bacterium]|nr:DUF3006 domain-containing protein [Clostridia bacterium]
MIFYLDRIEADMCVFICEGKTINIPKSLIPDCREGDKYEFIKSTDATNLTKNEELVKKLFK